MHTMKAAARRQPAGKIQQRAGLCEPACKNVIAGAVIIRRSMGLPPPATPAE